MRGSVAASGVAIASLALTAGLVFALATLSAGVPAQLGRELRAYGANLVVVPRAEALRLVVGGYELASVEEEHSLAEDDLRRIPAGLIDAVVPALAVSARLDGGADVAATGYDLAALRAMNPAWKVSPRWPGAADEILVGSGLAAQRRIAPGQEIEIAVGERRARARVAGTVETGGAEDEALLLPLEVAQRLSGRDGRVSLALARAPAHGAAGEEVARAITAAVPGAEARTIAQVAAAETALLGKVRRLLGLVTVAVAAASAFTVFGTLGILLLARRREIGLYLAIGAEPGWIRRFLWSEAAVAALLAGVAGCALGAVTAEAIALGAFGSPVPLRLAPAGMAMAGALAVALPAAVWPIQRALSISPCDSLRAP